MNHKRLFFCIGIILLIFCHALSACSLVADNEPASDLSEDTQTESETVEEVEDTERFSYSVFPQGTVQINDGKAVYNDGKISFQWDITKWYLTETNGLPMLHRADEKTDVFFCVFDCIDGTAGNLGDFSAAALKKTIPDYNSDKQFFVFLDSDAAENNWIGATTGYYSHGDENKTNILSYVHSVSNGQVSCVYGVMFKGFDPEISSLYDQFYEQQDPSVLESYIQDILDTFELLD